MMAPACCSSAASSDAGRVSAVFQYVSANEKLERDLEAWRTGRPEVPETQLAEQVSYSRPC